VGDAVEAAAGPLLEATLAPQSGLHAFSLLAEAVLAEVDAALAAALPGARPRPRRTPGRARTRRAAAARASPGCPRPAAPRPPAVVSEHPKAGLGVGCPAWREKPWYA